MLEEAKTKSVMSKIAVYLLLQNWSIPLIPQQKPGENFDLTPKLRCYEISSLT